MKWVTEIQIIKCFIDTLNVHIRRSYGEGKRVEFVTMEEGEGKKQKQKH